MFRRAFLSRGHQSSPPASDIDVTPTASSPGASEAALPPWTEDRMGEQDWSAAGGSTWGRGGGGGGGGGSGAATRPLGLPSHIYSPLFTSGLHPLSSGGGSPTEPRPAASATRSRTPLLPLARMSSNASHAHSPTNPSRLKTTRVNPKRAAAAGGASGVGVGSSTPPRARKRRSSDSIALSPGTPLKRSSSLIGVKGLAVSPHRGGMGGPAGGESPMRTPPSAHRRAPDSLRLRSASDSPYALAPLERARDSDASLPALFDAPALHPRKTASHTALRPFRFKDLLVRATSRAGSRAQTRAGADDAMGDGGGEETLDEIVIVQRQPHAAPAPARTSSASDHPREAYRPSAESQRGKSIDLHRFATASYGGPVAAGYATVSKASLRSFESARRSESSSSEAKSSFDSAGKRSLDVGSWGRVSADQGRAIALEPLNPRRKSPSPLRPASRAGVHESSGLQGVNHAGVGAVDRAPSRQGNHLTAVEPAARSDPPPGPAPPTPKSAAVHHKIVRITPPPLDRVIKEDVVTPVSPSSIRTFGPHAAAQQHVKPSTTPTFKLTPPGGKVVKEAFPSPHQATPERPFVHTPVDSQHLGGKANARQRTESGSFEYQAFESEMEIKGAPTAPVSRIGKKSSTGLSLVPSPIATTKVRAKPRPESGLMPLVLNGRSPLKERSNLGNTQQSTPSRKTGRVATKFAPSHMSPPAPLRITKRTSAGTLKRQALDARARRDSRPVDWNLESEFASLEVGVKLRD